MKHEWIDAASSAESALIAGDHPTFMEVRNVKGVPLDAAKTPAMTPHALYYKFYTKQGVYVIKAIYDPRSGYGELALLIDDSQPLP